MLSQVSIFTENSRGAVQNVTALLAEAGVNITGFVTNDSAEYGIIRMLVSDAEQALGVLKDAGYLCRIGQVTGVEITDDAGSLNDLLSVIRESNVNVDYIYVTFDRGTGRPVAVFHSGSILEVEQMLGARGYRVMQQAAAKRDAAGRSKA